MQTYNFNFLFYHFIITMSAVSRMPKMPSMPKMPKMPSLPKMPNMGNISNVTYLSYLTYALIISGYLVTMFMPQSSIEGYSCVIAGLFFYMMLKLVPLTKAANVSLSMFLPFLPIIAILGIVSWTLAINVKYSKNIRKGDVTNEYKTFNFLSFILLLFQLGLLARLHTMPYATTLISLIVSFQILVVFIMQMNLEYFITDG